MTNDYVDNASNAAVFVVFQKLLFFRNPGIIEIIFSKPLSISIFIFGQRQKKMETGVGIIIQKSSSILFFHFWPEAKIKNKVILKQTVCIRGCQQVSVAVRGVSGGSQQCSEYLSVVHY